jgi:hypothetical protein
MDDALRRHVLQELVHQSVVFAVQLVLGDADLEELQVAHVLPATQTGHFSVIPFKHQVHF